MDGWIRSNVNKQNYMIFKQIIIIVQTSKVVKWIAPLFKSLSSIISLDPLSVVKSITPPGAVVKFCTVKRLPFLNFKIVELKCPVSQTKPMTSVKT